ncbi:phytanoyl-CoA dioxygenase family protein [Mesonia aestuariivivens]|uniref:Phytanoyl-CoA dioxygenase family protein n=1 Tax=Mesonia aestuariivivens TaxID=2796128 RepID=A0ABS6W6Y5_9FLAO|nr:phytanoyl-CoA dioxygenase family protein [Mesonia aestuariivivens]MBW2962894.1 phytanoyl-CoA dioxygenase family protein [Mesonia aestuariivivens]
MKYFLSELKYSFNNLVTNSNQNYVQAYNELKEKGFVIVENFISKDNAAELRKEIDYYLKKDYSWNDNAGSDGRVYGIERVSDLFKNLFKNEKLHYLYSKYIDAKNCNEFIMANRVEYKEGNLGSGGGWHRDSMNRRQLKFILYLTDVNEESGCFQYIPGTHKPLEKYRINKSLSKKLSDPRYSQEEISKLVSNSAYNIEDLIGEQGTLIVVETSGIHRGKPIEKGYVRYAATNYMSDADFSLGIKANLVKNK